VPAAVFFLRSPLTGSSLLLYAGVAFFGAALFGQTTESNIMLNALSSNPWGNLLLNGCMLFYLAAGAAACQYPLRTSIDMLLVGEHVPMTVARAVSVLTRALLWL
jgi:sodium-coupled neutral amino acid transporter 10/sodium-coupled neutral amino acid transporter 11